MPADTQSAASRGSHSRTGTARFPDPLAHRPLQDTAFLRTVIEGENIEAGDYSYYHDPKGPEAFQERCVRYHFDFVGDRLVIGKFCAFATDIQIIMNGANHAMTGISTYPFNIFGHGWEDGFDYATIEAGLRGDTVIGHDVWIGTEAMILPGARIGAGSIIGSRAVVGGDIPPYSVVVGNPGRVIRRRFDNASIDRLLAIAWWDWPVDRISRHLAAIRGADIDALEAAC